MVQLDPVIELNTFSIVTPSQGGRVSRVMPASPNAALLAIETSGSVWRQ